MTNSILLEAVITDELNNLRQDQALAALFPDYSRTRLQAWIANGEVKVDGNVLRGKDKVKAGQKIVVTAMLTPETHWQGQDIKLDIVYEDECLLVINKPAGLVVHPAAGNPDGTLVNALLHYAPELAHVPRAGIVHRLDKDTSGLLVVARTLAAHTSLVAQLQARTVKREYLAVVNGTFTAGGTIDAPMARHPQHRTKMAVSDSESAREAITHYRIKERFAKHTAVQVFLETGRTHQIRVHMAHIGHPLVGDSTYGKRLMIPAGCSAELQATLRGFKRQALHARCLTLIHPQTGETLSWEAPVPEDLQTLLECLRESVNS